MSTTKPILSGSISDLAKRLLLARADPHDDVNRCGRAVFWIGAGASVSAGLPSGRELAGRLSQLLAAKLTQYEGGTLDGDAASHEAAFSALQRAGEVAENKTLGSAYGDLFAKLDPTLQRDFIRKVILSTNRRQVNWTHLALGELVRQRIVHTLLTTNFDDLLLDGLVRCDQLPAILDGVESLNRLDSQPPVPQLVYLHGSQHTYSPRNSAEAVLETRELAQAQGGLFGLLQHCSVLTIVGYAGNPGEGVMELLVQACRSLPGLPIFWVAHGRQDSLSDAARDLLTQGPSRRLLAGQDCDLFFRELLRELKIGVPVWFKEPVDHLLSLARRISVSLSAESAELRDEIEDFQERLFELRPKWAEVGVERQERRDLRRLVMQGAYAVVWQRLRDRSSLHTDLLQMRAEAAYELGRRGLEDTLHQSAADWRALLCDLSVGSAEWGLAQERLGDALATLGERGNEQAVREAIAAYGSALSVRTRERMPLEWASTRSNQGLALLTLGEWGDEVALLSAMDAFRDALSVYTKSDTPDEWAVAKTNLAGALQILGKRGEPGRLEAAVAAYSEALQVQTRDRVPFDWAITMCNRASALASSGPHTEQGLLQEAVKALDEAAQVFTREVSPCGWATIKNNQGVVLLALGQRGDEAAMRRAIVVFREALEVRATSAMAADWITTSNNLGNALLALGLQGQTSALGEAMEILSGAMEGINGEMHSTFHSRSIELIAQEVFQALWRVASREAGAVVGMALPRVEDAASRPPPRQRTGSRVLVAEDDELQREIIDILLRKCISVVEIRVAKDGLAAMVEIEAFKPDLLILDLGLPHISGKEVLAHVRATRPNLPVLVYSGDKEGLSEVRKQQLDSPGAPVAVLFKDADTQRDDDFKRLVPALFKRRRADRPDTGPATL